MIVAGAVCLYLSDKVVTGWWQGTLDAFGVGFIVGGMVDVLAITALNQALTGEQRRLENNLEAASMLSEASRRGLTPGLVEAARDHLIRSGRQIDPKLRKEVEDVVAYADREAQGDLAGLEYALLWPPLRRQTAVTLPRHPGTPELAIRRVSRGR